MSRFFPFYFTTVGYIQLERVLQMHAEYIIENQGKLMFEMHITQLGDPETQMCPFCLTYAYVLFILLF